MKTIRDFIPDYKEGRVNKIDNVIKGLTLFADYIVKEVEELKKKITKLEKVEKLFELQITINKQFDEAITKLETKKET